MVTTVVSLARLELLMGLELCPDVETKAVSHAGVSCLWLEELFTPLMLCPEQSPDSDSEVSPFQPSCLHAQHHSLLDTLITSRVPKPNAV